MRDMRQRDPARTPTRSSSPPPFPRRYSVMPDSGGFSITQSGAQPPLWLSRLDDTLLWVFVVEVSLRILTFTPPELRFHKLGPSNRLRTHIIGRLRGPWIAAGDFQLAGARGAP